MTDQPLPPGATIDGEDIWNQVLNDGFHGRPALFLDRDGVVVVEVGYLHRPEEALLEAGAAEVIARANAQGIAVVLVTNQAGIARGMYGWTEFAATQARILADLAGQGARVDAVYACPHHKEGIERYRHPAHPARKPRPGMLVRAAGQMGLDMAASWIVGDRASDLEAGKAAGLAGGLHVLTGHGGREGERDKALAASEAGYVVAAGDGIVDALQLPLFRQGARP